MSILSGNTLRNWSSKLLARDAVFRAVQNGLHSTLGARRALDRNAERVLSLLDVPSRSDIRRLQADIEAVDETLADLQRRLARLRDRVQDPTRDLRDDGPREPSNTVGGDGAG